MPLNHAPLNLEQLRKQAKELLRAVHQGDSAAHQRFEAVHPRIHTDAAKLADAQLVIARENGYSSWPKLRQAARGVVIPGKIFFRPFEKDIRYYADRADGLLSAFQDGQDGIARQIASWHPRYRRSSAEEIRVAFDGRDARMVVAREHGCNSWEALEQRIGALARGEAHDSFAEAFEAVKAGEAERLRGLLESEPGLARAVGTNHTTLLNLAVSCKQAECVKALLSAGADVDAGNRYGVTALHSAAYSGNLELVELLLEAGARVDLNGRADGGTALVQSLFWGHVGTADRLAEIAVVPLNLRVAAGLGRVDLIERFFDREGEPTPDAGRHRAYYRPHPGFPPWSPSDEPREILDEAFVYACKSGRVAAMEALAVRGADVNGEPYNGTGLMWAVHSGQREAVDWLLRNGAETERIANFGGVRGVTALHVAAWSGRLEMVMRLVERGARLETRDPEYHGFAWGWAHFHGHKDVASWLAEFGSRENIFYAVAGRLPERVEALVGRDPSAANRYDGWTTPLVDAASRGYTDIVRILLKAGAETQARNAEGKTAREAALAGGHQETAALLSGLD